MTFLLDHDVPVEVQRLLRREGHQAVRVVDCLAPRATDEEVFGLASERGWMLVTCNRGDFLSLAREQTHAGLVILIRRRSRLAECAAMLQLLRRAGESGLRGNINFA